MNEGPFNITIGSGKAERDAVGALEIRPVISSRIGSFVGLFGAIETILPHLFAELMGVSDAEGEALLRPVQSFRSRIAIVGAAIDGSRVPVNLRPHYVQIAEELIWLNAERNRYAHANYALTSRPDTVRRNSFWTGERETQVRELTAEEVDADIRRAKKLMLVMWDVLKATRAKLQIVNLDG